MKDKNNIIFSINVENTFYKIKYPFAITTLNKVGIEGTYLNIIKPVYNRPSGNIIPKSEKLKILHLRSGKERITTLTLLFNIVHSTLVLAEVIRQEKEGKYILIGSKK